MPTVPQQQPYADEARERDAAPAEPSLRVERSFEPRCAGLPPQVAAFADGAIDQARVGGILMVSVRETEVDSHNWEPFAEWLVDEVHGVRRNGGALILDLRRVKRLSSRGLRALALAWQKMPEGGVMTVCGLSPIVREIFQITHYDRLFEIHDDSLAAFRAVSERPSAAA